MNETMQVMAMMTRVIGMSDSASGSKSAHLGAAVAACRLSVGASAGLPALMPRRRADIPKDHCPDPWQGAIIRRFKRPPAARWIP
jgi:hypothetical protein